MSVVGVSVGASVLRAGVVRSHGAVEGLVSVPLEPFSRPTDALEQVVDLALRVVGDRSLDALGIGIPGWVEKDTGLIARAPNLGWINVPFGELLERRLGVPVAVHNDLKANAWGEYRFGAGLGATCFLEVLVGSGIGSAMVLNGSLWTGVRGFGGELGHVRVGPDEGPVCGCGRRGCLETYLGQSGLARRAEQLRLAGRLRSIDAEVADVSVARLTEHARRGDPDAIALLEKGGDLLGRVVGEMITFLNPDVVLLGGSTWNASLHVQDSVRLSIDVTCHPDLRKSVRLVESALGMEAGVIGAADLARLRFERARSVPPPEPV